MKKLFLMIWILILIGCIPRQEAILINIAEVNGTKLYYEVSGKGIPVIMIHGWSFDSRCWRYQIPVLSDRYQIICYDLRGFGKSVFPDSLPYSHTEDLITLMDYLDIEKAVILGHSFGGRIAIEMTLKFPERIIGLILPEAAMDANDFIYSQEIVTWISDTWKTAREEGIEKAKKIWINGPPLLPALINEQAVSLVEQMINDYSGWHWNHKDPVVLPNSYSVKKLNEIRVPTLILYGKESPSDYYKIAQIQHENIPGSKLSGIESAGHALNIENPEEFNREVMKFLKEIL